MKFDIIIIGSGLGGLICGTILAKAGQKVCVLERAAQPGGCMQSYKRGDFRLDTGLHYVGGLAEGQNLYKAFDYLGLMDLPWKRMDRDFDHVIIGGREFRLCQGHDDFVESLSAEFPTFHEQIKAYADRLQDISADDMDVNAWQYLTDTLCDELLVDVVSAPSMKIELKKDTLPLFSFLHSNMSFVESSWRLRGDGNMIVDRLVSIIKDNGGEVKCNSEVTSLAGSGEKITSAVCSDGNEYSADSFVSDIHPAVLSTMLDSKVRANKHFIRRMKACENTSGMFTTSLVLKPATLRYLNHNAYIYDCGVWDSIGEDVSRVMVSCRCPETDDGYARQVDLLTPMTWEECKQWEDTTVMHRGSGYKEMCERKAQDSIRLAERFVPSLGEMVERMYTSSPLTYRDYLSAPEGTAFGIRKDSQMSMLTYHPVRTPYANLFLTGQNVVLPGVEGVTMTAFDTCRHILGENTI